MSVRYRAMEPQDLHAQRELFRISFPEALETPAETLDHYSWKFRQFPSNGAARSFEYIGHEDGTVVAYYAALPYRYSVGGRTVAAGMVCDVMTHPAWRGRGLFTAIGRHATDALGSAGIAFVTGYPVRPEVIPGHLKVGWRIVQSLPVWLRPTGLRSLLPGPLRWSSVLLDPLVRAAFSWVRPTRAYQADILSRDEFLSQVAAAPAYRVLLERWKAAVPNALEKDACFLSWRTGAPGTAYEFACLRKDGELVGTALLRRATLRGIDCLAVLDIMIDPAHRSGAKSLHHALTRRAAATGADAVACMCSEEWADEYRMRRSGFIRTPATFSLIVKRVSKAVRDDEVYDARRWHVFWIDSDDL